jgi:hypothetical protein
LWLLVAVVLVLYLEVAQAVVAARVVFLLLQ